MVEGNNNSGTPAAFLPQLRQGRAGPLKAIWDNARAHRGEAVREYVRTPGLELRLVNLPGYSPDFNRGPANSGQADQPERRGETALPDSPAFKGRITPERLPAGITTPGKCASHLGFGLGESISTTSVARCKTASIPTELPTSAYVRCSGCAHQHGDHPLKNRVSRESSLTPPFTGRFGTKRKHRHCGWRKRYRTSPDPGQQPERN